MPNSERLARFNLLVAEVMAEWRIPGLAMAVLRRDEPPALRCWGACDIDTGAPVTTDTMFPICSVTKSFTATALALLVDEGKLEWDRPVREYLPDFRLCDPIAADQATLRDLLTHRTGLPRHDWVHMAGHLDNTGMLGALRHLEPSKPFRSAYQYNNLMYLVAGLVLERASGQRWEDFIRTRILLPLGMERVTTSLDDMLAQHPDCAMPHLTIDDALQRVPVRPINPRPAGGICASIAEMAEYMRFQLDPVAGHGGLRLSPAAAVELRAPQIYLGPSEFPEVGAMHKGFGFNVVLNYRGARRIDHGGGWLGYNCDLRLLPDHGGGVMVLTNRSDSGTAVLTNTILDHLLGLEPLPWLERLRPPRATRREQAAKDRAARAEARHRDTRPSHALPDYAHDYAHPAYGEVRIICDGDALRWQGMSLDLPMAHRHYDVFETASDDVEWFGVRTVQFATGVEGDIESLCVPLEPAVAPIVFRRQPEAEMTTRAFLEPLAGVYRYLGIAFRIAIDETGRLTFTRNQGPTEPLLPRHGMIFGFSDTEFIRVEFRRNAAGAIDGLIFHEPTSTYVAERDASVETASDPAV
jgi:CubicO group peptidase (beta-lactamase class C family)